MIVSVATDIKTAAAQKFDEAVTEVRSRADDAKAGMADEVSDVAMALRRAAAVDLLSDAFGHCKLIGWADEAAPLLAACGLDGQADAGFCRFDDKDAVARFVTACRALRHWPRKKAVLA